MRVARVVGCALVVVLGLAAVSAQFGHPLKGSWSGDWGPNPGTRHRVLIDLQWDGKALTGTINPGPDSVAIERATVNVSDWTVRFEAPGYLIEGKLENIGAYARFITGTWTERGVKGDFKVTRN